MEEESFLHPSKSPQQQGDQPRQRGSFRAWKDSTATRLQKAKWRVTRNIEWHRCTAVPTHWCGYSRMLKVQPSEVRPRERTGVGCVRLKRPEYDNLGCTGKKPGPTREARLPV